MDARTKSTVEEIRARFDADVERFANLDTGQVAAMDASEGMRLVTHAAAASTPSARAALDLGCGAGNFSLCLRKHLPHLRFTLVDLSVPMLDRAQERLGASVESTRAADMRTLDFGPGSFDIIVAAAVLHHLRTPDEWEALFGNFFRWLRPGGGVWIFDLVSHEAHSVEALMRSRYGAYLEDLGGAGYRDRVLSYIEREDTPASLTYQLSLLGKAGFESIDVLHKNACFAAFGATKRS